MIFFTIEHPTRGTLVDYEFGLGKALPDRPRFQWSKARHVGQHFSSVTRARQMLKQPGMAKLARDCKVIAWSDSPRDRRSGPDGRPVLIEEVKIEL